MKNRFWVKMGLGYAGAQDHKTTLLMTSSEYETLRYNALYFCRLVK